MIKNSIEVTINDAKRSVVVNTLGSDYSEGHVGKAYFCWKSDEFDIPYVRLNGSAASYTVRLQVKAFLMEYKRMLLDKKKSPLHFKGSDVESVSSPRSKKDSISGVPHWMRVEHKVKKQCFYKDGSGSYWRHTHFKPESKDIVEKYLPNCSGCVFRVNCEKACDDPDLMSQSEVFKTSKSDDGLDQHEQAI